MSATLATMQECHDSTRERSSYSILMPAPNVTGHIHIGHGLNLAIQDVIARWHVRGGREVYWPPGLDHGGIATQHTVERWLADNRGDTIDKLGRDGLLQELGKWKEEKAALIHSDMASLGLQLSWSSAWYTMDEERNRAVTEAFVQLYHKGFIYRENGIVNWCPRCRTSLSDLELSLRELTLPHFEVTVEVESTADEIPVNVVRPELLLGATAIAVQREGKYASQIGKHVRLPLSGKWVPVIANDDFGTRFQEGGVLVCPGHSPRDFRVAQEQGLDIVDIFNEDGSIGTGYGEFSGLRVAQCRDLVVKRLAECNGITEASQVKYGHAHCYRCESEVLPKASRQWYLRTADLAQPAIESVQSGEMKFNSDKWRDAYMTWMKRLAGSKRMEKAGWWEGACLSLVMGYSSTNDWVISRQILWGHPIPAWDCSQCGHVNVAAEPPVSCSKCGGSHLKREQGVLDMWFSCATWPLSVAGWPDKASRWEEYLPFDVTVIGHDVLYFWVTATNMLSQQLVGRPSFKHVYIHGLVADAHGKKMTKSLGNVINVQDVVQEWGTDVFRAAMVRLVKGHADDEYLRLGPEHFLAAKQQMDRTVAVLCTARKRFGGNDFGDSVSELEMSCHELVNRFKLAEALELIETWIDANSKCIVAETVIQLVDLLAPFYPGEMHNLRAITSSKS